MERGGRRNLLDPAAAEFRPAAAGGFAVVAHPQFYYPYPHPPPPSSAAVAFSVPLAAATRAVVLSLVPRHVGEAEVRAAMEPFGEVQAVDMSALAAEGVVTVHFYDLRSAQAAVSAVREQHAARQQPAGGGLVYVLPGSAAGNWGSLWGWLGGGVVGRGLPAGPGVWAQFAAADLDEPDQGAILVLNSEPTVSCAAIAQIFEGFGAVKEVKVMPSKQHHKLVEFYDKRDAASALSKLNGKEIHGRRLVLQLGETGIRQTRSIYSKKSSSTHYRIPFPPSLLRGSPKASRWIHSSGGSTPKPLFPSSPRGEFQEVTKPLVLLKRSSDSNSHVSMSNVEKKNSRVSSCRKNDYPSPSSSKLQHRTGGRRLCWKNHPKKEGDSRFLFKEGGPVESSCPSSCRDSRTTVMIRNIPNKYSQKLLLKKLDNHCIHCNEKIGVEDEEPYSAYDFVYLPIDFNNKCNVGYGFVNLTSPEAAFRLYKALHQQPWEAFNSRKICQITYARLQGLDALMEHFRNSKFACDDNEYMPAVFSPPRDGRRLTDPVPVAGGLISPGIAPADDGCAASSATTSTHAPSDHGDGGDDENAIGSGGLSEAVVKLSFK